MTAWKKLLPDRPRAGQGSRSARPPSGYGLVVSEIALFDCGDRGAAERRAHSMILMTAVPCETSVMAPRRKPTPQGIPDSGEAPDDFCDYTHPADHRPGRPVRWSPYMVLAMLSLAAFGATALV
jgi:hypothetical protein